MFYELLKKKFPELNAVEDMYYTATSLYTNGINIGKYWNPLNRKERERIQAERKMWEKKTRNLLIFFSILWVLMIAFTVLICIFVI